MATIKIKFRPSSVEGKPGKIFYQIIHNRQVQQITTSMQIHKNEWDVENGNLVAEFSNSGVQNHIDSDMALLRKIIKDLDNSNLAYTANDIVSKFKATNNQITVLQFIKKQINLMQNANRLGTARNYEKTMNSFSNFLQGEDIHFSMMTEVLIDEYNTYLIRRGVVRNTISFYMRNLRAIYNKASKQKLTEFAHPFQDVYTGIDHTRKRAIAESIIIQLYKLNLSESKALDMARDIFIFSYCTRGMAFVDIAYLKKSNIQGGIIHYSRRKTGQLMSIKIESNIQAIIDKYCSEDRDYLFPIISSKDAHKAYKQYRLALNKQNRLLKELSEILPTDCRLTSYTSRHSWATAARNHNVPISVISAGLGHTSEQTTQIYLTMLENSVIDEANRGIVSTLNE